MCFHLNYNSRNSGTSHYHVPEISGKNAIQEASQNGINMFISTFYGGIALYLCQHVYKHFLCARIIFINSFAIEKIIIHTF